MQGNAMRYKALQYNALHIMQYNTIHSTTVPHRYPTITFQYSSIFNTWIDLHNSQFIYFSVHGLTYFSIHLSLHISISWSAPMCDCTYGTYAIFPITYVRY